MTVTLTISLYPEIWSSVYEQRWDFEFVLLGPFKYTPTPFDVVAEKDSEGVLSLLMTNLICESKGGSVGEEGGYIVCV